MRLRSIGQERSVTLFVDPLLADPLRDEAAWQEAVELGAVECWRIVSIHPDIDPARVPYLLHMPDSVKAERLLNCSVALATRESLGLMGDDNAGRSLCAWIVGVTDVAQFARRLRFAARVVNPAGQIRPLRFWDPRVVRHLPRSLDLPHWRQIRAAIGNWWFLDDVGELVQPDGGGQFAEPVPPAASHAPFRVSNAVWSRLERIVTINKVLALASKWGQPPIRPSGRDIDALLARSQQWGYRTERDMLVFATFGLMAHSEFDRHPKVAAALKAGAAQAQSLQEATAHLGDDFWRELSAGRWLANADVKEQE